MKQHLSLFILLIFIAFKGFSQLQPVLVAELTIRIMPLDTKELLYGFAEGDTIIFSFREITAKPIYEFGIIEEPTNVKFSAFKVPSVMNKEIAVHNTGIYRFRFENTSLSKRVVMVKIERIPKSEEFISFNTGWELKNIYDTTYTTYTEDTIIGYDTTYIPIKRKEFITDKLELVKILDNHSIKVNVKPIGANLLGGDYLKANKALVKIDLPRVFETETEIVENVEWYYSVSVDQRMKLKAIKTQEDLLQTGSDIASTLGMLDFQIAFELLDLTSDKSSQSVYCALIGDYQNAQLFYNSNKFYVIRQDNIVNSPGIRIDNPTSGTVYLGLSNPDEFRSLTVYVNAYAWQRRQTFRYVDDVERKVEPRFKTLQKRKMHIKSSKVRVNLD